jgi:hypothetical protein
VTTPAILHRLQNTFLGPPVVQRSSKYGSAQRPAHCILRCFSAVEVLGRVGRLRPDALSGSAHVASRDTDLYLLSIMVEEMAESVQRGVGELVVCPAAVCRCCICYRYPLSSE